MEHLYVLPILLFSVVVHEIAHGYMALRLGDPTARDMGRLTFNPIPHIDFFGSILLPLMAFFTKLPVMIAWAKPVPVNPMNFRNFRRDDILVSLMGPLSNFVVAFLCVFGYIASASLAGPVALIENPVVRNFSTFIIQMFAAGITVNIFLAVFNLIPIPPLDGSHILSSLLPEKIGARYRQLGFMGFLLVLALLNIEAFQHILLTIVLTLRAPYDALLHVNGY